MASSFSLNVPTNLSFQDYLAICQVARTWADGYDLKSLQRLSSTLAPEVVVDYTDVNPAWSPKRYRGQDFSLEWLSEEHLGNRALRTQHLLGLPYFDYVGPRRNGVGAKGSDEAGDSQDTAEVEEIQASWQTLASHGRLVDTSSTGGNGAKGKIDETADHRAMVTHVYIKVPSKEHPKSKAWKISLIKPSPTYGTGDFARIRRPANMP